MEKIRMGRSCRPKKDNNPAEENTTHAKRRVIPAERHPLVVFIFESFFSLL